MSRYRLHYFPESGNSYKLALMLTLCGESFEGVWTDFGAGVTRTAEWRAAVNIMGEIPVLEWDGESLTQTAPILLRLAAHYGRLGGATEAEHFEVLRWLFWDNHRFSATMATYRFLRCFSPRADPAVLRFLRGRMDDHLSVLEHQIGSRDFVTGTTPTIADLSISAYVAFPADETGYALQSSHPAVHAWLGRVAALPGWRAAYDLLPGPRLRRFDRGVGLS